MKEACERKFTGFFFLLFETGNLTLLFGILKNRFIF